MAVPRKIITGGLLLALLGWGAEGQGNTPGKVSGSAILYLGQERDIWRPLIHTTANLSEIRSIKSCFQLRTFDAEGAIFYGDTKNGEDWFVLALKDGIPLMQISKEGMLVSAMGGPKLNDGKWHTLEVSNQGRFVVLKVDGSHALVVGMQPKKEEEPLTGKLRLAVGGILIDSGKLLVQFEPQMDGCVQEGSWLNLSIPWESEAGELWPCYQHIQPGSYFPGTGFAIFNTSDFPLMEGDGVKLEIKADFTKMDGTIFSIKAPGQPLMLALVASNNTKEVTLNFGSDRFNMKDTFESLAIIFKMDSIQMIQDGDESKITRFPISPIDQQDYLISWREGHLALGGLLGEGEGNIGSQFLTGCLEKIQVQGRDLDLDSAVKHNLSISSHSCPA